MATKAMGGLFKKRFLAKDARGCEFWVLALYDEPEYKNGVFVRPVRYMAHGFSSDSLDELKKLIAKEGRYERDFGLPALRTGSP